MVEDMDIDKGKAVAGDGPSTSGKNFDLPWVCVRQTRQGFFALSFQCSCTSTTTTLQFHWTPLHPYVSMFQVEKYRPQLVKDIVGNVEAVGRMQVIAEEGNLPNVILSVSPDRPHQCQHLMKNSASHGQDFD